MTNTANTNKKMFHFEIRQIDAWAEDENNWVWNNSYRLGEFKVREDSSYDNDKRAFLRALKAYTTLPRGKCKVEYDGDAFEVVLRKTGEPLFAAIPLSEIFKEDIQMKATRKMKLKELYNKFRTIELEDDDTETGGISYMGETLDNFLDEVEIPYDAPLEVINKALVECGIRPVQF